jgi:phosphoglycerol transferase MdoB-like AlkP superfamily enzyme
MMSFSKIWRRRLIVLLIAYAVVRLLFLILNQSVLSSIDTRSLVFAFVIGLRFDLCSIATINLPIWATQELTHAFTKNSATRAVIHNLTTLAYIVINAVFLGLSVIDARLYSFTGRRTTPDFFVISKDITTQSFSILVQYWPLTLGGLLLVFIFGWITWRQRNPRIELDVAYSKTKRALLYLVIIGAGVLAIRGGVQRKPLSPAHAFIYQPPSYANLILNSPMTLLKSAPSDKIRRYHDFESRKDLLAAMSTSPPLDGHIPLAAGKNVVVVVVESLASEYVGFLNQGLGYTPFLDDLCADSVTFRESFANGRRSIDAMPAIFGGVPAWRDQPFVMSPFQGNSFTDLPRILKERGYKTAFFHGAANGSMHFDVFASMVGFEDFYGQNEYPRHGDNDGEWGIFDEPFLIYAAEEMKTFREPFFSGIFTLSSHNPFPIPDAYRNRFPKGTLPIHESIGYADFALSRFFTVARQMPWYANTIFVITGDHTSLSDRPAYNNVFGRFKVPIIFFDPSETLPKVGHQKIAQHVDIVPSLMDILGIEGERPLLFGHSLFDPSFLGRFVQYEYGSWHHYTKGSLIKLDESSRYSVFQIDDHLDKGHPMKPTKDHALTLSELKALRQYYSNGLIDNDWKE